MADQDDRLPTVNKRGNLTAPYPIRTRGDVNRARVLPPPEPETSAPVKAAPTAAPKPVDEQPKGAFDYVRKRNQMMKGVSFTGRRAVNSRRA